jgi:hypothetical protein
MTPRAVLFMMIAGFFAVALLLIHNAYYNLEPVDRAGLSAIDDQG